MSAESTATCFVIMPIRKEGTEEFQYFRALHDTVITPALKELGYQVTRADDVAALGSIAADVVKRLAIADIVIADLSDLNANVFYELGYADGLGKRVIVTAKHGTELPFDVKDIPTIFWRGQKQLKDDLTARIRKVVKTAVSSAAPPIGSA